MSTQIAVIKGIREAIQGRERKTYYLPESLFITRYFGGEKNGTMLQLTINNSHIQLTKIEIDELKKVLDKWQELEEADY